VERQAVDRHLRELESDPRSESAEAGSEFVEITAAAERCQAEIAAIERLLLSGHPDVAGLCLALSDWSAELRLIEGDADST
jgi:hypothetical protein